MPVKVTPEQRDVLRLETLQQQVQLLERVAAAHEETIKKLLTRVQQLESLALWKKGGWR